MCPQQLLHAVVSELRFEFGNGALWIAEQASEGRAYTGFRPGAFEQDAVEDFNLIEMVPLRFKELPSLVNSRLDNGVIICCERYVGAVRFEEVLVNMEAWTKGFHRRLQALHRILLLRAVETFVVHAGNAENHADITALGKEGRLVPEAIEVDVVVESRTLFPGLDDSIETQHHTTSTRGTCCFAAS